MSMTNRSVRFPNVIPMTSTREGALFAADLPIEGISKLLGRLGQSEAVARFGAFPLVKLRHSNRLCPL